MRVVEVVAEHRTRSKIVLLERLDHGGEVDEPRYSLKIARRFDSPERAQNAFERAAHPGRKRGENGADGP